MTNPLESQPIEFVGSFPDPKVRVDPVLPEIALIGRSNVGKSSLLNVLVGRPGLARVSGSPGKTTLLNFYRLPELYLVDLPGYGFARASHSARAGYRKLVTGYLRGRETLAGVVWLLDIRRDPSPEDHEIQDLLIESGRPVLATFTKVDKLTRSGVAARSQELARALSLDADQVQLTSSRTRSGISDLATSIVAAAGAGDLVRLRHLVMLLAVLGCAGPVGGQSGGRARPLPAGYGSLSQNDLALRLRNDDLEIRFIPLDPQVTRLLAPDAYQSLLGLVETHRRAIDSVSSRAGVSQPGLALVSFFGLRPDVRFDPQTLTLLIRNRVFRPLGVVPLNPKFTSGQLNVREQASALFLFEENIPVNDSFTLSYGALTSEDWQNKQTTLDRERARVSARASGERRDTTR